MEEKRKQNALFYRMRKISSKGPSSKNERTKKQKNKKTKKQNNKTTRK